MTDEKRCPCGGKPKSRGLCHRCYEGARRRGEFKFRRCTVPVCHDSARPGSAFCRPCGNAPDVLGLPVRFWHYVRVAHDVPDDDPCWIWTGTTTGHGWPQWSLDGVMTSCHYSTHRAVFGEYPANEVLWRSCGSPACVQPAHGLPTTSRSAVLRSRSLPRSGFRGVRYNGNMWQACARSSDGVTTYLGAFHNPSDAHEAYRVYVSGIDVHSADVA